MKPTAGDRFQEPVTGRFFVVIATGVLRVRIRYEDDGTEAVADHTFFDQPPIKA